MNRGLGVELFIGLLFFSACTGVEKQTAPRSATVAYQHTMVSLDPHAHNDGVTGAILSAVFQPLVEIRAGARVKPVLADTWTTPQDDLWRFRVRRGIQFHDGRELRPEDVVFSIQRAMSSSSGGISTYLQGIETVSLSGEDWVEIRTAGPFPLLLSRLAMVAVVPQNYRPEQPIGTGPYRWISGDTRGPIILRRFEAFWGPPPEIEELRLSFVATDAEVYELIRGGQVDVVGKTGIDFLLNHPLSSLPKGWGVVKNPASATTMLGLNIRSKPLDDPRVRLAIDLCIDREELVRKGMPAGAGTPASALVPEEVFGASPRQPVSQTDIQRARKLLKEAGVAPQTRLRITHSRVSAPLLAEIEARLSAIGFQVLSEDQPFDLFYRRLGEGSLQSYIFGWNFDLGDASDFLEAMVHSHQPGAALGQLNGSGFADPLVDGWIESASREISQEKRLVDLRSVLASLQQERPYLPLFFSVRQAFFKKPLGMKARPGSWLRPYEIRVEKH